MVASGSTAIPGGPVSRTETIIISQSIFLLFSNKLLWRMDVASAMSKIMTVKVGHSRRYCNTAGMTETSSTQVHWLNLPKEI